MIVASACLNLTKSSRPFAALWAGATVRLELFLRAASLSRRFSLRLALALAFFMFVLLHRLGEHAEERVGHVDSGGHDGQGGSGKRVPPRHIEVYRFASVPGGICQRQRWQKQGLDGGCMYNSRCFASMTLRDTSSSAASLEILIGFLPFLYVHAAGWLGIRSHRRPCLGS